MWILSDVGVTGKSKMAAINRKYICNSSTVLLDPENVGVAAGISLLSCIQAEIYGIEYVLPVSGSHP